MTIPRTRKKSRSGTTSESRLEPTRSAALNDIYGHAGRFLEMAAIVRAVRDDIVPAFYPEPRSERPRRALQRKGAGPRPATIEAILEAEKSLEELARVFDGRARELLQLRVDLGDAPAPDEVVELAGDDVVAWEDFPPDMKKAPTKS